MKTRIARSLAPMKAAAARTTALTTRQARALRTNPREAASTARLWLARHYVGVMFAATALVCLWALWIGLLRVPGIIDGLLDDLETTADNPDATRGIVIALAAALATITIFGTLIVQTIRVWTNERTTRTVEQGHVTDRLTKAIEQLGAEKSVRRILRNADGNEVRGEHDVPSIIETTEPNLEVRLGAIYALERIAIDSERDHATVIEILCAYVRENAKDTEPDVPPNLIAPRIDIQATLSVVGRRANRPALERKSNLRLDFSHSNLVKGVLRDAQLDRAILSDSRFESAVLVGASMQGASLIASGMAGADFQEAQLQYADLSGSRLEGAIFKNAKLQQAVFWEARLRHANFQDAHAEDSIFYEAKMVGVGFRDARLQRADLRQARMRGAHLDGTHMEGANVSKADLRNAFWAEAKLGPCAAHSADMRGARGLEQVQLEGVIGNAQTLLPDGLAPDTGQPYYIWSCWEVPPEEIDSIILKLIPSSIDEALRTKRRAALRAQFLCSPDNPRRKTGTPLALDAPYPDGHPLAGRDDN